MNTRKLLYSASAGVLLITGVTTAVLAHSAPDTTTKTVAIRTPKQPTPPPKVVDDTVTVTTTPAPIQTPSPTPETPTQSPAVPSTDPVEILHQTVIQQATVTGQALRSPNLATFINTQWACLSRGSAVAANADVLAGVLALKPSEDGRTIYRYFDGPGSCRIYDVVQ